MTTKRRKPTKTQREELERENRRYPSHLVRMPLAEVMRHHIPPRLMEVWRSRDYLVQVFDVRPGMVRLSVCRTSHNGKRWVDGIPWDDLQRLKRECGRGDCDAVEVYPADEDVVNVANMRHLFVFEDGRLDFAWRKGGSE